MGLLMLLRPMLTYFSCLVSIAFFQGMSYVAKKLYHKHLPLQLCFGGTIVEELQVGNPRFTKHYQHAADKSLLLKSWYASLHKA